MVQITINGKQIEVPEGITVLRAAEMAGITIPTLCDHKELTPFGGCRLCIVEVQGFRVPIASCTLPVSNGMVVNTETESLKKSRKFILSMLFSERNHFCPFCQVSGGDCELQNAAYHEEMTSWPMQPGWNNFKVDTSHPYYILDNNRCILCRRCVRACGELVGNFTLAVAERGAASTIVADYDVPLGDSSCIKCGTCVQVCPTGALIDRTSAYLGHDEAMQEVKSTCTGCSVGCAVKLIVRNNRVVRIEGDWDGAVNRGLMCEVGRYKLINDQRARVTSPMMKKNGKLVPVTWDEALGAVADKLKPLAGKNGVAAIASTRLTAEALANFKQLFAESLGGTTVTSLEEGATTAVLMDVAGEIGAFEGKQDVLRNADAVLCLGEDLVHNHMVAGFKVKRALPKGTRLISVDSNPSDLHELADVALTPAAGTLLALVEGLTAVIVKEGLGRNAMEVKNPAEAIEKAIKTCNVPAEKLTLAARTIAQAVAPVILFGTGVTASRDAKLVKAIVALAKLIGAVDGERVGLLALKGKSNSVSAAQMHLDVPFTMDGQQVVYAAVGDDILPEPVVAKLLQAPYLVVQTAYESPLTEKADVVLPVALWSEQAGHYVNLDGRVQKAEKALTAPDSVRENAAVLSEVALRMNMPVKKDWKAMLHERKSSVVLTD